MEDVIPPNTFKGPSLSYKGCPENEPFSITHWRPFHKFCDVLCLLRSIHECDISMSTKVEKCATITIFKTPPIKELPKL